MIFLIEKIANRNLEVDTYDDLAGVARRVEWQDILDDDLLIMDESGQLYKWDNSKLTEYGSVYNYSFKTVGEDKMLLELLKENFTRLGRPANFQVTLD